MAKQKSKQNKKQTKAKRGDETKTHTIHWKIIFFFFLFVITHGLEITVLNHDT